MLERAIQPLNRRINPYNTTIMKFSVSSSELNKGLSTVIGAVPNKATLPILETILFKSEESSIKLCH